MNFSKYFQSNLVNSWSKPFKVGIRIYHEVRPDIGAMIITHLSQKYSKGDFWRGYQVVDALWIVDSDVLGLGNMKKNIDYMSIWKDSEGRYLATIYKRPAFTSDRYALIDPTMSQVVLNQFIYNRVMPLIKSLKNDHDLKLDL